MLNSANTRFGDYRDHTREAVSFVPTTKLVGDYVMTETSLFRVEPDGSITTITGHVNDL